MEQFKKSTEKYKHLLKAKCCKDGCKGKLLFIWDQRDFFAPSSMSNQQACITICAICIGKKMLTNPPLPAIGTFSNVVARIEDLNNPVNLNELFRQWKEKS